MAYDIGLVEHAGCDLTWLGTDSEQAFKHNKIKHPDAMANWYEHSVSYRINAYGFRGGDMLPCSAMFLGCSHTFGIGLPETDVWTWLVSENLGLPCVNLGVNGGSNDTAFRLAYHWIPKLRPKIVFWLHTYKSRLELLTEHDILNYSPNVDREPFYESWVSIDENMFLNFEKNHRGIRSICDDASAQLVMLDVEHDLQYKDKARDQAHCGVLSNRYLADMAISKID